MALRRHERERGVSREGKRARRKVEREKHRQRGEREEREKEGEE
jgi:hypothetical protein